MPTKLARSLTQNQMLQEKPVLIPQGCECMKSLVKHYMIATVIEGSQNYGKRYQQEFQASMPMIHVRV
jgi:hypothetical protein